MSLSYHWSLDNILTLSNTKFLGKFECNTERFGESETLWVSHRDWFNYWITNNQIGSLRYYVDVVPKYFWCSVELCILANFYFNNKLKLNLDKTHLSKCDISLSTCSKIIVKLKLTRMQNSSEQQISKLRTKWVPHNMVTEEIDQWNPSFCTSLKFKA